MTANQPHSPTELSAALADHAEWLNRWLVSRLELAAFAIDAHQADPTIARHPDDVQLLAELRRDLAQTQQLLLTIPEREDSDKTPIAASPTMVLQAMEQVKHNWLAQFPSDIAAIVGKI